MRVDPFLPLALWVAACGGGATSSPPAEPPPAARETVDTPGPAPAAETGATASASTAPAPAATTSAPPPVEFPPHASVEEAIKAVPQGSPRLNMSNDVLHAPLLDLKRYDKCKVPRSTKVSMDVAVYDGMAVGVDVTTKPKSAKIEECLDGIVRSMTWEKVPSLNQVTVNF